MNNTNTYISNSDQFPHITRTEITCGVYVIFNIYMLPLAHIGTRNKISNHNYVDDTQLYIISPGNRQLPQCISLQFKMCFVLELLSEAVKNTFKESLKYLWISAIHRKLWSQI